MQLQGPFKKSDYTHIIKCFNKDYEHLFDVPYSAKIDNDALGLSPVSTLRPPGDNVLFAGDSLFSTVKS